MQTHCTTLPRWLLDLLATPPAAGTGIHSWLYHCACRLATCRPAEEVRQLLTTAAARCSRPVPEREITDAIQNARNDWRPDGLPRGLRLMMPANPAKPQPARWPVPDWPAIARIAASGAGLADLWEASPVRMDGTMTAADLLAVLFPGDPLLCMAKSEPADALTTRLSVWNQLDPAAHAFIVPSPMTAPTGKRQDGKASRRCLDNTGPRRFLVVEFDFKAAGSDGQPTTAAPLLSALAGEKTPRHAPDLCAALLLHLAAQGAPLALAVHSGGKSVHGWFPTHGAPDGALRPFFAEACRLGADPATWTRCQLIRTPEGTRADGRRQPVYYFNFTRLAAA